MTYQEAHRRAQRAAQEIRTQEGELIKALQDIIKTRAWRHYDCESLHMYAVKELKLSHDQAYQYTRVASKGIEVPELTKAIDEGTLNISNARRILTVITEETKNEWIEKATSLPQRELEREVVKVNPKEAIKERIKPIAENLSELRVAIPKDVEEMMERIKDLESQRTKKAAQLIDVLRQTCLAYLKAHDPLLKATRNLGKSVNPVSVLRRKPTAQVAHQVRHRDQDQCTHRDKDGQRCSNRRWLEVHHQKPFSRGGLTRPDNLVTLCHFHHREEHPLITRARRPSPEPSKHKSFSSQTSSSAQCPAL